MNKAINDYINYALELEREGYKSDLEPFDAHASKIRIRLREGLLAFQKSYAKGYRLLLSEIVKLYPDEAIWRYHAKFENLKIIEEPSTFIEFLSQGKMLYELFGFSHETMVRFYEAASHLLEEKHYEDAIDAFFFLVTIAPNVSKIWRELGLAYRQNNQFERAIDAYLRAIDLDPKNADSYLACAGTFVCLKEFEKAFGLLDIGLEFAMTERGETWAEEFGTLLEEGKRQIDALMNR